MWFKHFALAALFGPLHALAYGCWGWVICYGIVFAVVLHNHTGSEMLLVVSVVYAFLAPRAIIERERLKNHARATEIAEIVAVAVKAAQS